MKEVWKDVLDYPDVFMVSNYGNVWSKRSHRILKQTTTKAGYKVISSRIGGRNGKCICKKVHIWVAECFVENVSNKPYVNHKDGDKTNNFDWNLEWCTIQENTQHAYDTGLIVSQKGECKENSKLTDDMVRYIKANHIPRSNEYGVVALAKRLGISHAIVSEILSGKRWTHIK